MDSEISAYRSLPPLVEGKLHGYLKLTLDEVVWSRRNPGYVTILASWWGELDSAQFRPVDVRTGAARLDEDIVETYAVRTNRQLFAEYLKNCETIELVVICEKTREVIGIGHVVDLLDILEEKNYSRYFPIRNASGNRLGDVRVQMKFTSMSKSSKSVGKSRELQKLEFNDRSYYPEHDVKSIYNEEKLQKLNKLMFDDNSRSTIHNYEDNNYKSILKDKRMKMEIPSKKLNVDVTDKLVAQVVARAQRLRGAIIKETYDEDPLALSESSVLDDSSSDVSAVNEAKLYEYFLGNRMSRLDERKALETLRTISPTPSLIDLASETIHSAHHNCKRPTDEQTNFVEPPKAPEQPTAKESVLANSRESSRLDQVDSMKIFLESLSLSPAGYRRVRSSCVSRGDRVPLSVTYFVEYNGSFPCVKKSMKNVMNEVRPTKVCSKKQVGQVIYFNHQAIFNLPKSCLYNDAPLKFKVFNRHLNQRTPTLLGVGSIYIDEVAEMETFSTTQKLAIINKGMKMGELKVNIELGCDGIHFGKDYVEAITATKQNIPVFEISPTNSTINNKIKSVAGSNSKPNSRVSSSSKYSQYSCSATNTGTSNKNGSMEQGQLNNEDKYVRLEQLRENNEEKVLLHGLIYVAEGKGLPISNTYLICRAFWREDKAASQLCNNTENPVYHFHELVPLLHGQDLLERTKDNFIAIEVWNRNIAGQDNLLGIAKLSVHQLYVAYRDPLVVPHLLLSKYPVISVDGWVPICEPVTGLLRGELLALVALGTADQIAFLELTRGLRSVSSRVTQTQQDTIRLLHSSHEPAQSLTTTTRFLQEQNHLKDHVVNDRQANVRTQESQTEITTMEDTRPSNSDSQVEPPPSQNSVLHALVDHLAQALNVPKSNPHQTPETRSEMERTMKSQNEDRLDSDLLSNDSASSVESSPRDNFHVPTGMYRSVGVGAEYEEPINQPATTSYAAPRLDSPIKLKSDSRQAFDTVSVTSDMDESSFRAHVEIECALHLPRVEVDNGTMEPSTYVTFQPVRRETGNEFGPYKVTNIFPTSCSPKWDWRCDTRLSSDLLVNDQKRMILKIWRLSDPASSKVVNLDKDIVIGFAAVDLSILLAGFPLVSGWFHIIDFTGKCNGQIKVTVTPLENLTTFVKSTSATSLTPNCFPLYATAHCSTQSSLVAPQNFASPMDDAYPNQAPVVSAAFCSGQNQFDNNDLAGDIGLGFNDVSMTFLSQSLKQKLTELDEITKRLKSRLHDVTAEDFDVDFDPEFDPNEPDSEPEVNRNSNVFNEQLVNVATQNIHRDWQSLPLPATNSSSQSSHGNRYHQSSHSSNDIPERYASSNFNDANTANTEPHLTDTGYSTTSHAQSRQSLSNGHLENENRNGIDNGYSREDQPARGARTHINHLLDKLNLLTSAPPSPGNFPIKRNIHDFIASLRYNSTHTNSKCNQEVNVRTVPTQTEYLDLQSNISADARSNTVTRDVNENNTEALANNASRERNKVSALIREELVADEANDTTEFDDLTTHLLTTNVRHMDLDSIFNPLMYQHMIPEVQTSNSLPNVNNSAEDLVNFNASTDRIVIEDLDNRYSQTFNATIHNGLDRLRDLVEVDSSLVAGNATKNRTIRNFRDSGSPENSSDLFRTTPTGVFENVDGNIDVTIIRKPSNDDLMASNSTDSTTTLSLDTSSLRHRQMLEDEVLSSSSSVSVVTRQAPDGGNPVEETKKPPLIVQQSDIEDSSTDS